MKITCLDPYVRIVPALFDEDGLPVRQVFPCGKCPVCRSSDAKDWMLRLSIEMENSLSAHFLTLTYNEKNIIRTGSVPILVKQDLQLFIKRLRSRIARQYPNHPKLRFFGVGEYGGNTLRPHYHVILFNLPTEHNTRKIIEDTWKKGFITLSKLNGNRIAYVACYSLFSFLLSDNGNATLQSPFRLMSRRPGLGYQYVTDRRFKFFNDTGQTFIQHRGFSYRFPRFFRDRFFITEEDRKRLSDNLAKSRQSDSSVYQSLYGELDKHRLAQGLSIVQEEFEQQYLESLKRKYVIHKMHRKV